MCQTKKHLSKTSKAPMKPVVVNSPWMLIGIDITGPLVKSVNNNLYIIVAADYFSKFCIAKAIPDATANSATRFVYEEMFCGEYV